MITKLFTVGVLSILASSYTAVADDTISTINRPIRVTFDPNWIENNSHFRSELESLISQPEYHGYNVIFTEQNYCDPNDLYITDLENDKTIPNIGIVSNLKSSMDPTQGGFIKVSIDNISFSSSINDPKPEFTPAQVLLSSFLGESSDYDSGYATVCYEKMTQCVTYIR